MERNKEQRKDNLKSYSQPRYSNQKKREIESVGAEEKKRD